MRLLFVFFVSISMAYHFPCNAADDGKEKPKKNNTTKKGVIKLPRDVPGWLSGEVKNLKDIEFEIPESKEGGNGSGGNGSGGNGSGGNGSGGNGSGGNGSGGNGSGGNGSGGNGSGGNGSGGNGSGELPERSLDDPEATRESGTFRDGGLIYTVMQDSVSFTPFVRDKTEYFSVTVETRRDDFEVIINGNWYGYSGIQKTLRYFIWMNGLPRMSALDPSEVSVEGTVISDGKVVAGASEPMKFYVAANTVEGKNVYTFGFGDPPINSANAIGGLGPVIIDGMPYGVGNKYREGVPEGAAPTGEPAHEHRPYLTQRNNDTYADFLNNNPRSIGTTVIAHDKETGRLVIVSQPHNTKPGQSLDDIRDILVKKGFDNAVFIDGSDSVLLTTSGISRIQQGQVKDETNIIGIGFGSKKVVQDR